MLTRRPATGTRLQAPVSEGNGTGPAAVGAGSPALLDPQALQHLRDLDPAGAGHLMDRIVNAFAVSAAHLIPQLQEAQRAADASGVRYVVHTLRSSSASVGAVTLSRMCAEIEAAALRGGTDGMHDEIAALACETAAVLEALKRTLDAAA